MDPQNPKNFSPGKQAPSRLIQIAIKAGIQTLFSPAINKRIPSAAQVEAMCGKRRKNNIIAVCAMPKSGSTFLSNVLKLTLQKQYVPICFAYSSNEHDLYLPAMLAAQSIGAVSQLPHQGDAAQRGAFQCIQNDPRSAGPKHFRCTGIPGT